MNKPDIFSDERVVRAFVEANWTDGEQREHTNNRGQWIQVPTPHKSEDRKRLLGFNLTQGYVSDLYLGKTLPFIAFVKEFKGFKNDKEAQSHLIGLVGSYKNLARLTEQYHYEPKTEPDRIVETNLPAMELPREAFQLSYKLIDQNPHPLIVRGLYYAQKRDLTEDDLKLYEVHYCIGGQYGGRLLFPIRDGGKIVSFQTRTIRDDLVDEGIISKSLNPPVPKVAVYGLENLMTWWARNKIPFEKKRIIICEGPIDAIRAYGVAPLGSSMTDQQLERILSAAPCEVILAMDMDMAGLRGTFKLIEKFFRRIPFRVAAYDAKDVGAMKREDIESKVVGEAMKWGTGAKTILARRAMDEERKKTNGSR